MRKTGLQNGPTAGARLTKQALFGAFLAFLASWTTGIQESLFADVLTINEFSGLNTDHNPATLTGGQTPDSENVVTDEGPGLYPRHGFTLCHASSATAQWVFPHSNGTKYQIIHCGDVLKADTGACTFDTIVSTVASGIRTAGAVLGDYFYFTNTTDGLKSWDGTTVSGSTAAIAATQLVAHKARLWAAGIAAAPRTVYASKFGDGSEWDLVTDPVVTDPAQFQIGGSIDEPLTTLYASHRDDLVWMKPGAFGVIAGNSRADFAVRTYSDIVGTAYPDSVRDCDGLLRFMGPARTIYEWNGAELVNIGQNIQEILSDLRQGDANARSYTITTQGEFGGGTFTRTTNTLTSGDVNLAYDSSSADLANNDFETGTSTSIANWTNENNTYFMVRQDSDANTPTPQSGTYMAAMAPITATPPPQTADDYAQWWSSNYSMKQVFVQVRDSEGSVVDDEYFGYTTNLSWSQKTLNLSAFEGQTISVAIGTDAGYMMESDQFLCAGGDLTFYVSSTFSYEDGVYYYWNLVDLMEGGRSVQYTSGTYVSSAFSLGSISSFATFGAADTEDSGTITYTVYTDSDTSHTVTDGVPVAETWVSSQPVTNGALVTLSTAAYAFIGADFVITDEAQTPTLHSLTLNWTEGVALPVPSSWFRQRYWLGVAHNSTTNNRILVFDRNRQWQRYNGINAATLGLFNGALYFGNSAGMYLYETGYSDDGTAIASYFRTPTFSPSGPNLISTFNDLTVTADYATETLATTFQINGVTDTDYSLADVAMNAAAGIQNRRLAFPFSQVQSGRNISILFSVSGTSLWNVLGATLDYVPGVVPE